MTRATHPGREVAGRATKELVRATARSEARPGREAAGATTTKAADTRGGAKMENKANEMVDAWMKSQNEFTASWAKAQKEGVERWAEAVAKMQESFMGFTVPEGPMKEARNFYASLMGAVVTSVKAMAEDSAKIQETVKAGMERQVEMSREVAQRFTGLFPAAAQSK
jgi:hypothetical protein